MEKKVLKFELNGKILFLKPFQTNNNLDFLREKINEKIAKIKYSFKFLDRESNPVNIDYEKDFIIEDILDGQIVKLKSIEDFISKEYKLNVFLSNKKIVSMNLDKDIQLNQLRKLIKNEIQGKFIFLDIEGNDIEEIEEKEFIIDDILNNEDIKIKKIYIDFSKYEVFEKKDNLTIYKYSNKERQSNHKFVYQYFYDEFNSNDYKDAYIILFFGKIGDGKTTSINAIFNIIKGIELEDNYRFILITELKKIECNENNYGIHIYYIKDYNNKPVIIINCQGNNGEINFDEKLKNAFKYIFFHVINHINVVCFISKSTNNRLDTLSKSIFSSAATLFSKDISEDFIILSTFANNETIKKGPSFINTITTDADFLNFQNRQMDEKWWFSFDSKCILDNEEDKLTKYSFSQLNEFYEEKVKKLLPKSIEKCDVVLKERRKLKIQINLLSDTYQTLLMEQSNLKEKEKCINEISKKIEYIQIKIQNFEKECKIINQTEQVLIKLNNELNEKLNTLNNETISEYKLNLEYDGYYMYNHCDSCQRNCHDYCDCFGSSLGRCKYFSFYSQSCENCGCLKEKHKIDHYHYVKKLENKKKDNSQLIQEEKNRIEREKKRIYDETNRKNSLDRQINELNYNKNMLINEKEKNIKEENEIKKNIEKMSKQIIFIIIKLKKISETLSNIANNKNHLMTENDYIDSLLLNNEIVKMGINNEEQMKVFKTIKENIKFSKK